MKEERKWNELHRKQKEEGEKRIQKLQLVDAERIHYMKEKDKMERLQREQVVANKMNSERQHEDQMQNMIARINAK